MISTKKTKNKKVKKFVAIGLGNFGLNLSIALVENGCEVLGIDPSKEVVEYAKDFVTQAIIADATNKEVLKSLALKDFDGAIVSIGQEMAPSILISMYLKEIGVEYIIVRAISDDHGKILTMIGVSEVIFPEKDMAIKLGNRLALKNVVDYLPIAEGYGIVEVAPPESFIGKNLIELQIGAKYNCQIVGIKYYDEPVADMGLNEKESSIKIAPSAYEIITDKCVMVIIGKYDDIEKIQKQR